MTFNEFVEALLKAGWVDRNDAQHENIRELWNDLCFKGMNIPIPTSGGNYGYTANVTHRRK